MKQGTFFYSHYFQSKWVINWVFFIIIINFTFSIKTLSRFLQWFSFCLSSVLPKAQRTRGLLLFWEECVHDNSSPFCCHIDSFTKTLKKRYTHKVKAKQPGQSEKGTKAPHRLNYKCLNKSHPFFAQQWPLWPWVLIKRQRDIQSRSKV